MMKLNQLLLPRNKKELKEERAELSDNIFDEYIISNEDDRTKVKFEAINKKYRVIELTKR